MTLLMELGSLCNIARLSPSFTCADITSVLMLGGILSCGFGCICMFSAKKLGFVIFPIS